MSVLSIRYLQTNVCVVYKISTNRCLCCPYDISTNVCIVHTIYLQTNVCVVHTISTNKCLSCPYDIYKQMSELSIQYIYKQMFVLSIRYLQTNVCVVHMIFTNECLCCPYDTHSRSITVRVSCTISTPRPINLYVALDRSADKYFCVIRRRIRPCPRVCLAALTDSECNTRRSVTTVTPPPSTEI